MANPQVIVEFIAKVDKLKQGFTEADKAANTTGGKLKTLGKVAIAAAGAAGLAALTYALHTGIDEYTAHAKVAAQTNAVIKSTGDLSHVTAQHVADLADQLQQKSGVDHNTVQNGENILLTFRNIRNELGKGNDVWDQATKATLDMSVALGKDMGSSAILVGKALNDPVKGLTALRRVGVQFTKGQEDQIKAMVASGNTMGAQKLILQELNKEFGGSAQAAGKTVPGQLKILKENFNDVTGSIVGALAPALGTLASLLAKHPALVKVLVVSVLALSAAMVALNVALAISAALEAGILAPVLAVVAGFAALVAVVILVITHFQDILNFLTGPWGMAIGLLLAPWIEVPVLIASHFDDIINAVKNIVNGIVGVFTGFGDTIIKAVNDVFGANGIGGILSKAFGGIASGAQSIGNAIGKGIGQGVSGLASTVSNGLGAIGGTIGKAFNQIWQWGANVGKWMIEGLKAGISWFASNAWSAISGIGGAVFKGFQQIWSWGKSIGQWIWEGVKSGVSGLGQIVWSAISAIGSAIWRGFNEVWNWGKSIGQWIWEGLKAGVAGIGNALINLIKAPLNAVIGAWNGLHLPKITIHGPFGVGSVSIGGWGVPQIPYLAAGGIVTAPTLAMIGEAGPEMVLPLGSGNAPISVRVFIGDQELRGMIRAEVTTADNRTAQTLLSGLSAA